MYVRVNRFRILIESRERSDTSNIDIGVITLCDLAGSENEKIAGEKSRVQEAKFINKVIPKQSLLTLNTVILKLSEEKNNSHLPLRDSKLTRILGPLLQGTAKIVIIATLNPTIEVYEESLNSLQFAKRSRNINQVLVKNNGVGEISYLFKYKSEMAVLKERLEGISGVNSLQSSITDEEEIVSIEVQIENLQNAILISESIRDCKMLVEDDLLYDFSERRSLRLKYWRESTSTVRNSSLEEVEVEEEDSLPIPMLFPRISDVRMSIPEEPCVNQLSPFQSKTHLEMFQHIENKAFSRGSNLLQNAEIPLPHPNWLRIIMDQESLITELQSQLSLKIQENSNLKEEIKFCKDKLVVLKARLIS